ncbi:MAG: RT0821/Lpp0805 family surface protein [Rhizobiaceae bacterium]
MGHAEPAEILAETNANAGILKTGLPRAALLCALAAGLTACSLGKTMSGFDGEPALVTSSIAKPVKAEGIDSTDAELIKDVVAGAESSTPDTSALAWSNPDTGNRGTITAIDKFVGSHGQKCKKFQTTVDSFMGISLYNGETCELRAGFWVLSWFLRD